MKLETLLKLLNKSQIGLINPEYPVQYWDIDRGYPIIQFHNLWKWGDSAWVPLQLIVYCFSTNAKNIPLLLSLKSELRVIKLADLQSAIITTTSDSSPNFQYLVDLYFFYERFFEKYDFLLGRIFRNMEFDIRLEVQIDLNRLLQIESLNPENLPPLPPDSKLKSPNSSTSLLSSFLNFNSSYISTIIQEYIDSHQTTFHPILSKRKYTDIRSCTHCTVGLRHELGIYVDYNLVDSLLLLLPVSELFIQIDLNIAGFEFTNPIEITPKYRDLRLSLLAARLMSRAHIRLLEALDIWNIAKSNQCNIIAFNDNFQLHSADYTKLLIEKKFNLEDPLWWVDEIAKNSRM